MTFVFENEPDLEDHYLDPNNEQDLQKIILILQKLPSMRTKSELKSLYLLLQRIEFFKEFWTNMPSRLCFSLLKALKYEHTQKTQTVFRHGDDEKYFYLILKGSVYVIIPTKEEKEKDGMSDIASPLELDLTPGESSPAGILNNSGLDSPYEDKAHRKAAGFFKEDQLVKKQRSFRRKDSFNKTNSEGLSPSSYSRQKALFVKTDLKGERALIHTSSFSQAANHGPLTPEGLLALYPNHVLMNTLRERDHFGEIALKLHTKRTATIVSREICHFLVLDVKAYSAILSDYQDRLQHEMLNFFKCTPLTKDWPSSSLMGLMKHSKIVNLPVNNVIYNIGDPITHIYFIKQGEVEIIKEADIDFGKDTNFLNHQRGGSLDKAKLNMLSMNSTWKTKYKNGHKQQIRVAIIGSQQNFGEEEFLHRQKKRQSKAIVKSSWVELILIPTSKLIENAKDPELFRHALLTKDAKSKWRENLESDIMEVNQNSIIIEKKPILSKNNKTIITVTDNDFSGLKKAPPSHSRLPSLSPDPETQHLGPGMITRLMQRELNKKSPYVSRDNRDSNRDNQENKDDRDHITLRTPRHMSQANSRSPPSSRVPKSPEMLKKLLMQTFENRNLYTKGPVDEISSNKDDSFSMLKSNSVSKLASAVQSLEASRIITQELPAKQVLNTVDIVSFLGSSPSTSTLHATNTVADSERRLKSRGPLLSPLRQTGFSKVGKNTASPQSSFIKSSPNERPKIKKLLLKELDPAEQNAPPQFYVNSPKPMEVISKSFKDDMVETVPFLINPKIKINVSSPKLVMKIKSKMKSLDNSATFLASQTLGPLKVFDISKLNQLIGQKNLHLKNKSIETGKKNNFYNTEAYISPNESIEMKYRTKGHY